MSNGRYKNGNSDPLVVRSEDLANLILPIIHEFDAAREEVKSTRSGSVNEHRESGGNKTSDYHLMAPGIGTVSALIGIDPRALQVTLFRQDWVGYGKADEWLTALDLGHRVCELRPVPNKGWSLEHWKEWAEANGMCGDD